MVALLSSMVPRFAVAPLLEWVRLGQPADQVPLSQEHECLVFGFLKLAGMDVAAALSEASPLSPKKSAGHPLSAVVVVEPPTGSDGLLLVESTPEDPCVDNGRYLQGAHAVIGAVLSRYSAFVKVKSIGDVVMVAGPFDPTHTVADAAAQVLEAVAELLAATDERLKVGLNADRGMSTVIGSARLCFDIFGDGVNVASRCYTTHPVASGVSCTSAFAAHIPKSSLAKVTVGPAERRTAKGKGSMNCHTLQFQTDAQAP